MIPGDESLDAMACHQRWYWDSFQELHNDDALWAMNMRMSFAFADWRLMLLNDPTLLHLFRMGLFDWEGEDNRLHQTTQAMRHLTLLAGQIFERLLKTQEQVFFLSALVDPRLTWKI